MVLNVNRSNSNCQGSGSCIRCPSRWPRCLFRRDATNASDLYASRALAPNDSFTPSYLHCEGRSTKVPSTLLSNMHTSLIELKFQINAESLSHHRQWVWNMSFCRLPPSLSTKVNRIETVRFVSIDGPLSETLETYNRPFFTPTPFKIPSTSNPHDSNHFCSQIVYSSSWSSTCFFIGFFVPF